MAEGERIAREPMGLPSRSARCRASGTAISPATGRAGADAREFVLKIVESRDARPRGHRLPNKGARPPGGTGSDAAGARLFSHAAGTDWAASAAMDRLRDLPRGLSARSTIGRIARPAQPLLQNVGATLARVDRALQGFFHPSLTRRLAWDVRRLPELAEFGGYIESAAAARGCRERLGPFAARLPRLRGCAARPSTAIATPHNLLVDASGQSISGILDFGDMIHAPLIVEPAVAMSELLTEATGSARVGWPPVLQGYAQRPGSQRRGSGIALRHRHRAACRDDPGARLASPARPAGRRASRKRRAHTRRVRCITCCDVGSSGADPRMARSGGHGAAGRAASAPPRPRPSILRGVIG